MIGTIILFQRGTKQKKRFVVSYKLTYLKRFCSTKTALWVTERYAVIGQLVRSLFAKKKK